ncbi:copper resistance CopC/CopD family protein [Planococcus lenghuensis]|nr:copper resistance protein CopC [Planococcus lenghuensis]
MKKWLWLVMAIISMYVLLPAMVGLAHSDLVKTYPIVNEELTGSPETLEFWFRDPVVAYPGSIRLVNSEGKIIDLKDTKTDPENRGHVISEIPSELTPGAYTATANVIALDGFVIEEVIQFRVVEAASQPTASAESQEVKLLRYSPADGETTEGSPGQLEFWFNQPVTLTAVGVFGHHQEAISTAEPVIDSADPNHITVELTEEALPGTYQVTWYARPANPEGFAPETLDVFYFAVDHFTPIEEGGNTTAKSEEWFSSAGISQGGYWLWFTGLSALFGFLFFKSFIFPSYTSRRWRTVSTILFGLTAVGISAVLLILHQEVGSLPISQFISLKFVWIPLLQLVLLLAGLLFTRAGTVFAGVALLLTPLVTGHAAYPQYGGYWSIAASSFHLLAASVWIGGLIALITVPQKKEVKELLVETLPRYSTWALISLGVLVLTGFYMTIAYVPSFSVESFLESEWGKAVTIKMIFTLLIAVLGFFQRRTIKRLVIQSVNVVVSRAKAEVVYGFVVLLAAGLLVVSTPKAAEQGIYPTAMQQQGLDIELNISPLELGLNVLTVTFNGHNVKDAEVIVSMPPDYEVSYNAFHTGENEFKLTGNILHAAGTVDLTVTATIVDGDEVTFPFRIVVPGKVRYNE